MPTLEDQRVARLAYGHVQGLTHFRSFDVECRHGRLLEPGEFLTVGQLTNKDLCNPRITAFVAASRRVAGLTEPFALRATIHVANHRPEHNLADLHILDRDTSRFIIQVAPEVELLPEDDAFLDRVITIASARDLRSNSTARSLVMLIIDDAAQASSCSSPGETERQQVAMKNCLLSGRYGSTSEGCPWDRPCKNGFAEERP